MFPLLSKYAIAIMGTIIVSMAIVIVFGYFKINGMQSTVDKQNVELGVVAAIGQQQEVKIVESKQIEERVQVVTQDKIKIVKEYQYDANKTDCANAIDSMRNTF